MSNELTPEEIEKSVKAQRDKDSAVPALCRFCSTWIKCEGSNIEDCQHRARQMDEQKAPLITLWIPTSCQGRSHEFDDNRMGIAEAQRDADHLFYSAHFNAREQEAVEKFIKKITPELLEEIYGDCCWGSDIPDFTKFASGLKQYMAGGTQ